MVNINIGTNKNKLKRLHSDLINCFLFDHIQVYLQVFSLMKFSMMFQTVDSEIQSYLEMTPNALLDL